MLDSIREMTVGERLHIFPNLIDDSFELTSEDTVEYNCAAWVVGWKKKIIDSYSYWWPEDIKRTHTVDSYAEVYKKYFGFDFCNNGDYEIGFDKIVLFADDDNMFKHAALRINEKLWTSKMGDYEDIEHGNLKSVSDGDYGKPVIFMKRKSNEQNQ